jgi:hypothetical protein
MVHRLGRRDWNWALSSLRFPEHAGLSTEANKSQITIEPMVKHPRIIKAAGYPRSSAGMEHIQHQNRGKLNFQTSKNSRNQFTR